LQTVTDVSAERAVFVFATALNKASMYQAEGKKKPGNITQAYPNDGGKTLSRNTGNHSQKWMVPKHGIPQSHTSNATVLHSWYN
jgi:hypothetical protein